MASTIDDTSIDATFPVAGQDNNSQGFRDNFSATKNNLKHSKVWDYRFTKQYSKIKCKQQFSK